ncbi:MAG: hypothetical protein GXO70_05895 [Acidobacteria bacterium]|nr:hypothetical protein [Acidobacteriota bacterium]
MKRTVIAVLGIVMVAGTLMAAQGRVRQNRPNIRQNRTGMLFRLVAAARPELGLNETQNQKLDALLTEVKSYWQSQVKAMKGRQDQGMDEFVSDSFNAEAIRVEREKMRDQKRVEVEKFMTQKIQALHDLLTKDQRQKLLDIAKDKRQQFMNMKDHHGSRMDRGMKRGGRQGMQNNW